MRDLLFLRGGGGGGRRAPDATHNGLFVLNSIFLCMNQVAYRSGKPRIVFDWKSDVSPSATVHASYVNQIAQYARVLGAERGAIVYMSLGQFQWVSVN